MKNKVTLEFNGKDAEKAAECVYTLINDGGLEDTIIDTVSDSCGIEVEGYDCDNENHIIRFECK